MGAIKDITDLVTQLSNSVKDRRFAGELLKIQSIIGTLQSEQAALHEQRIALITENAELKQKIAGLEQRLAQPKQVDLQSGEQLDEIATKMLVIIGNTTEEITRDELIQDLRLAQAKGEYHFDQLIKREFVHTVGGQIGRGMFYYSTQKGREYLAKAGLL